MIENSDDYQVVVQQKMQARAERHVREQQAAAEEQARETQATQVAQALAEQAQQVRADEKGQREVVAQARRNRPALIAQYRSNPAGLRLVETLSDVCLHCGSEQVRCRSDGLPHVMVCPDCSTQWVASPCWNCTTGLLDSRDPETPRCPQCGWSKCAVCGACNPQGCSTNPYNTGHRQRDEASGADTLGSESGSEL